MMQEITHTDYDIVSYHTLDELIFKHSVSNALSLRDPHGREIPSFYLGHVPMQNHFR